MLMVTAIGFSYPETQHLIIPPSGISGWDNASGTFRPISINEEGVIKIEGDIEVDVAPSFKDTSDDPARAQLDAEDRVIINIGSETINLITGITAVKDAVEAIDEITLATETIGLIDKLNEVVDNRGISDFSNAPIILSVDTTTPTIIGDLGDNRVVYIYSDEDVNFGGSSIASGSNAPFIPGGAPFVKFRFNKSEPEFYLIGRTNSATIQVWGAE